MARLVQLMVAGDVAEAEEVEAALVAAGISYEIERAVEGTSADAGDAPQRVLVPESSLEAALQALEELGEPDELA